MSVSIANSLATGAHLSNEQLECAYRHYKALSELLVFSGPRFSEARLEAMTWGNKARDLLVKSRKDEAARRTAERYDDGLEEIH